MIPFAFELMHDRWLTISALQAQAREIARAAHALTGEGPEHAKMAGEMRDHADRLNTIASQMEAAR